MINMDRFTSDSFGQYTSNNISGSDGMRTSNRTRNNNSAGDSDGLEWSESAGNWSSVVVSDLNFSYTQDSPTIIENLNFAFPKGKITVVTGESGRGKSTLLFLLGLFLKPNSGSILIDNQETTEYDDSQKSLIRSNKIGFAFQDAILDPYRTVIESVLEPTLYRVESNRKINKEHDGNYTYQVENTKTISPLENATDIVSSKTINNSHSVIKSYQEIQERNFERAIELLKRLKVEVELNTRTLKISGGEASRVSLARALMNDPSIILADEPTGNLDSYNADIILATLNEEASKDKTVIIVSHDSRVVSIADEVLNLL